MVSIPASVYNAGPNKEKSPDPVNVSGTFGFVGLGCPFVTAFLSTVNAKLIVPAHLWLQQTPANNKKTEMDRWAPRTIRRVLKQADEIGLTYIPPSSKFDRKDKMLD